MTTKKQLENQLGDYICEEPVQAPESEDDVDNTAEPDVYEIEGFPVGERLDKVLAVLIPSVSRARLQKWIEAGAVLVNGEPASGVRMKVADGDELIVTPQPAPEDTAYVAEDGIDFEVLYEDEDIIVVNKPAGLVVHPAAGHWNGTLLNGLLFRYPELTRVSRAGIVHRLDKETSGLMVVARNEASRTDLVRQLQARTVGREYWAIVLGLAPEAGYVDRSIGRDPRSPIKFCCRGGQGSRPAKTRVRLVDSTRIAGRMVSWVACRLETGRTHQIRVHLTSVGLPLLGDPLYRTNASALPEEAGVAGKNAAKYIKCGGDHADSGKEIPIVATDGVRYTVPKTLHVANMDDELTVRFRVGGVYKNCYISTYLNDQRIICRKRPVMAPGEMEQVKLQKSVLEAMSDLDHITIKIEEEA